MHALPYQSRKDKRATKPLGLTYFDVWRPSSIVSTNQVHYCVLFVDDFTRFNWIFPFQQKSDVKEVFLKFKKFIE